MEIINLEGIEKDLSDIEFRIADMLKWFIERNGEAPEITIDYAYHYEIGRKDPVAIVPNVKAVIIKEIKSKDR